MSKINNFSIQEKLAEMRKKRHLSQIEVAKLMTEAGLPTGNKSVSSWEKGLATPNASQFLTLCKIYECHDIYRAFIDEGFIDEGFIDEKIIDKDFIDKYDNPDQNSINQNSIEHNDIENNSAKQDYTKQNASERDNKDRNIQAMYDALSLLNENGIQKVLEFISILKETTSFTAVSETTSFTTTSETTSFTTTSDISSSDISSSGAPETTSRIMDTESASERMASERIIDFPGASSVQQIPVYELPASAGTGEFLDNDYYMMVELSDAVPDGADFGIRIHGDSMMPRFQNGQTVWVRRTSELQSGDIGIFYLDGEAYCKQLKTDNHSTMLVSLNPKYAPIHITDTSDFRIYGKVL